MPWRLRLSSSSETCFWHACCATAWWTVSSMWIWSSVSFSFPIPLKSLGNCKTRSSLTCRWLWLDWPWCQWGPDCVSCCSWGEIHDFLLAHSLLIECFLFRYWCLLWIDRVLQVVRLNHKQRFACLMVAILWYSYFTEAALIHDVSGHSRIDQHFTEVLLMCTVTIGAIKPEFLRT